MWSVVLFREHQVGRLISLVDSSIISISIESQKNLIFKQKMSLIPSFVGGPQKRECAYFYGF